MPALSNLTIVDLTTRLPGPYCAMMFADFGANIIKVEPPGGDPLREFSPLFASVNRGKRSMVVNLKTSRGQAILARLMKRADVALEGFRPGVAARLGADYATVSKINPGLIYCSISGFGQDGPYRDRAGHDINYLSFGGLLGQAERRNRKPVVPPVLISDLASGMYAAIAVLAALNERQASGQGAYIDLSMTESVTAWMAPEIARAYAEGRTPDRPLLSGLPHYDVFETSDGGYLSVGIVYESHFWARLCDTLGLDDYREIPTSERMRRVDEIRTRLQQVFITRSRDEWDRLLQTADIPCAPVYTLDELPGDPHLAHRDVFFETTSTGGATSRQVRLPFRSSQMDISPACPPPELGEHTRPILEGMGYTSEEIERLFGMNVVE